MRVSNPFATLRRRMLSLVSGVFRRRQAPVGRRRRHRLTDRLVDLAGDMADSFARTADRVRESGYLTLAMPEMLEQKRVLDVGAEAIGDELFIFTDDTATEQSAFIETAAGGIVVSTDENMSLAGRNAVLGDGPGPGDGPWPGINTITVYEAYSPGTPLSFPNSGLSGGSGYQTAPSVTVSGGTPFSDSSEQGTFGSTIEATSATLSFVGSGLLNGNYNDLSTGIAGVTVDVTVAGNVATAVSDVRDATGGRASLPGGSVPVLGIPGGGTNPQITVRGSVDAVTGVTGTG